MEIVAKGKIFPSFKEFVLMLLTFGLTVLAWIFFRAESLTQAIHYISGIFTSSLFSFPEVWPAITLWLILIFMLIEWLGREEQYALAALGLKWKRPVRYAMYFAITLSLFWFGGTEQQFIYFQF